MAYTFVYVIFFVLFQPQILCEYVHACDKIEDCMTKSEILDKCIAFSVKINKLRLYLRKKTKRATSPTEDELFARIRFSTVAQAVNDRKKDLTKITADQQAFLAQKDLAGGKKTLKAWYWMVEGDAYDAQHPRG